MEEIAPVWYILTGDRIRLDDKEVGFCFNFKEQGSVELSWRFFRWIDEVTRIYY